MRKLSVWNQAWGFFFFHLKRFFFFKFGVLVGVNGKLFWKEFYYRILTCRLIIFFCYNYDYYTNLYSTRNEEASHQTLYCFDRSKKFLTDLNKDKIASTRSLVKTLLVGSGKIQNSPIRCRSHVSKKHLSPTGF